MEGTRDCNAWSSAEEIANSHHSLIAKRWAEYPQVVNRAACIASGQFVEQAPLPLHLALRTSCMNICGVECLTELCCLAA